MEDSSMQSMSYPRNLERVPQDKRTCTKKLLDSIKGIRMKEKVLMALFFAFIPLYSCADYFTGNDIMDSWNNKYFESNSMIRGYFAGVQDSYNGVYFCVESEVKMSQAAEVVVKYMKENPEEWHKPGKILVIDALKKAFPCKR